MKCPKCGVDNKAELKACRRCGFKFEVKPVWKPTWKWHLKTLGIIYAVLIMVFFLLNALLKPYMRNVPKEITPWLNTTESNDGSKAVK